MCGSTLSLENRSLSIIISQMVMPETEIEWIFTFKKLAVFPKLPKNQHEVIPDATNFDDWWSGIILYIFDANVINDFLAAVPANIKPVLKTFNQKPGLMQIFYDQIPMCAGKNINNLIDYNDLKQCENLRQYTDLFLEKANDINESSKIAKINRQKLASQNLYTTPPDTKIHNNNQNERHKFNNNNNNNNNGHKFNNNNMDNKMNGFRSNNLNNKNYSNNHGNHTNTPYKNPYERRLHRIQEDQVSENFVDNHWNSCDVDNDDEYDEPLLSTSNDNFSSNNENSHDIDDSYNHDNSNDDNYTAYDNSDSFEGLNPGSNVTNNLSVIQNSGSKLGPCFNKFDGKCHKSDAECQYGHSMREMNTLFFTRQKELNGSFYNPKNNPPLTPSPPYAKPDFSRHPPSFIKRPSTTLRSMRPSEAQNYHLNNHKFSPPGDTAGTSSRSSDL
jgi:hypothetical protein